jgi:REP element-mobilizing transposase RayT
MAGTYTNLLYHLVFSTKNRAPIITSKLDSDLHAYIGGIIRGEGGKMLEIGGTVDHIHIPLKLKPTKSVSEMLNRIKAKSSKWANEDKRPRRKFAWQDGYGAFTVSESQVKAVRRYIKNQKTHHRRRTFQDEFRALLVRHGIEFEERYLWG